MRINTLLLALPLALSGCGEATPQTTDSDVAAASAEPAGDRILPMNEMIDGFQAELPRVTALSEDAPTSRAELVRRFAAAVEEGSVASLRAITVNAAEFAWLYFPTSIYSRSPYAQPPEVNWLLLQQNSLKGKARLLRFYGGRPLPVVGHTCLGETLEGENRIHEHCTLRLRREDGQHEDVRLFGSILERAGRFKLLSLSNRL
jgi:hypothetical protein